jgi:predicted acetyltransferase
MPTLIAPREDMRGSYAEAMDEFRAEGRGSEEDRSTFGVYLRTNAAEWSSDEAFSVFAASIRADALEQSPRPDGYVPATELWWVDRETFLGRITIRHRLTPHLLEVGGHIGYDVRPSARRRGHATEMLRQTLPIAHRMGIDPALITCDVDNFGSRTVIERNGGVLEDERVGKLRFWVPTG